MGRFHGSDELVSRMTVRRTSLWPAGYRHRRPHRRIGVGDEGTWRAASHDAAGAWRSLHAKPGQWQQRHATGATTAVGEAMAFHSSPRPALCFAVVTGMALCCLGLPVEDVALLALVYALAVEVACGTVSHAHHHGKLDLRRGPSRPYHAPKPARYPGGLSRI